MVTRILGVLAGRVHPFLGDVQVGIKFGRVGVPRNKCKAKVQLFNSIKKNPNGLVSYEIKAQDDKDFSFIKYKAGFKVKWAGDDYYIYYNILIEFKEGKIRYTYSNFISSFEVVKGSMFGYVTSSKVKDYSITLGWKYSKGDWFGDTKKYWNPIKSIIDSTIKDLNDTSKKNDSSGNDW